MLIAFASGLAVGCTWSVVCAIRARRWRRLQRWFIREARRVSTHCAVTLPISFETLESPLDDPARQLIVRMAQEGLDAQREADELTQTARACGFLADRWRSRAQFGLRGNRRNFKK